MSSLLGNLFLSLVLYDSGGNEMPTKHIDDETWKKIEIKTVQEVIKTETSIKETDMLRRLILIGLKHYDEEQFRGEKKRITDSNVYAMNR